MIFTDLLEFRFESNAECYETNLATQTNECTEWAGAA